MRIGKQIAGFLEAQRQYFSQGNQEIARENLQTMQITGLIGATFALLFFVVTPWIIPSWSVTQEYLYMVPVLLAAFIFSLWYRRHTDNPNPRMVEAACVLFYSLLLAGFIALSVFPYPNTPQIFISLCFMFMPALLILRPALLVGIMLLAELVFLVLAVRYKTPFGLENDIFNTMAALVFSLVIMFITNRLRCRNFGARLKLELLSQTDALTGLLNKHAFEECSSGCLKSSELTQGCCLLVLDLDNFKQINDTYGHPFGDALLAAVGDVLRCSFRQNDLVGRIGGDEFAVLLCGLTDPLLVKRKYVELERQLNSIVIEGTELHPTCSVGAVVCPEAPQLYAELFRQADDALYQVKRQKKGSIAIKTMP